MKIGYFEHWFQPENKIKDFLIEQGYSPEKIDYSKKGYLDQYDVVFVEQNGFNDYIENDEEYINNWVKAGGILLFFAQDYKRWAPYFLAEEVGYTQLIHRHVSTIGGCGRTFEGDRSQYKNYMMPWIEPLGQKLFSEPEVITPDEMIDWRLKVNTFYQGKPKDEDSTEDIRSAAVSCYLLNDKWDVLGSYMDPAVRDGALIAKANHGKGMYFLSGLLFPEVYEGDKNAKVLSFWKKYLKNLFAYFARFKNGESEEMPDVKKTLPKKVNYKMAIHMHSLDWYGCDSHPGTINAMMRLKGFDICSLAIKHVAPYNGKLDVDKYSDDKVLFLTGQEYHPFNWEENTKTNSHNTYHSLAIGIDEEGYSTEFTKSLYTDEEIDAYLKKAINHVKKHNGAICATHPYFDYFIDYDFDAVDVEPMRPLSGENIEKAWLSGKKFAVMNSVDLFGFRRFMDNPAVNFLYLDGEPNRDAVVDCIKKRHVMSGLFFDEADIRLGDYLPGDEVTLEEASTLPLKVFAKRSNGNVCELRVYSAEKLVYAKSDFNSNEINEVISLAGCDLSKYVRVEVQGENEFFILNSTPFFIK